MTLVPRGLHRTRVSEMRLRQACAFARAPGKVEERARAVRLPILTG